MVYGYDNVVYLLVKPENKVSFVMGKSRVISRKKRFWMKTRKQLIAAVKSTKLAVLALNALDIKIDSAYF